MIKNKNEIHPQVNYVSLRLFHRGVRLGDRHWCPILKLMRHVGNTPALAAASRLMGGLPRVRFRVYNKSDYLQV